jgi:hypothetical protein
MNLVRITAPFAMLTHPLNVHLTAPVLLIVKRKVRNTIPIKINTPSKKIRAVGQIPNCSDSYGWT